MVTLVIRGNHSGTGNLMYGDEGSLQPSLWLPKLSSILQKLAKCSAALNESLGERYVRIAPQGFFAGFLKYAALPAHPATHMLKRNIATQLLSRNSL